MSVKELIQYFKVNGLDPNFKNYQQIGKFWHDGEEIVYDSQLTWSLRAGLITDHDLTSNSELSYRTFCHCGQDDLKYNCIIKHRIGGYFVNIGSRCFCRFTDKEDRKSVCQFPGCDNKHRCREFSICVNHPAHVRARYRFDYIETEKRPHTIFKFGKRHYGKRFDEIPKDYIDWLRTINTTQRQPLDLIDWFDSVN